MPADGVCAFELELPDTSWDRVVGYLASLTPALLFHTRTLTYAGHRWSFAFPQRRATITLIDGKLSFTPDVDDPLPVPSPDAGLDALVGPSWPGGGPADIPLSVPFASGWVGYLGYELGQQFEQLPQRHPRQSVVPDVYLAYTSTVLAFDHVTKRLVGLARGDQQRSAQERLGHLRALWEALDSQSLKVPPGNDPSILLSGPLEADFTSTEYQGAVARVREYLAAGDIFQANLTQRFVGRFGEADHNRLIPILQARALQWSPSPYGAVVRDRVAGTGDAWALVCCSPEQFLRLLPDGTVQTRPIKGTRPRGPVNATDDRYVHELLASAKDQAELAMIVDLERNDLGRFCRYGSIAVTQHAAVESFSNVHHLVSTVVGRLREGTRFFDVLAGCFPGGSISGAPKIRAMQIINELEKCRRGIYTGAIGFLDDRGYGDWNIAIRTLVVEGKQVHFHVGGGVVIDSTPESEYEETLVKARSLVRILHNGDCPPPFGWTAQ